MHDSLPSFLFVGPGKTGSTWIFKALQAHPEVFVPQAKELYFFNHHYARGYDWYRAFFAEAGPQHKAIGELTPGYLFSEPAAERIARDLPGVKVFACLRNPLERALSVYQFRKRDGLTKQKILSAVETFPEIVQRSRYAASVQYYQERFGSRFRVFLYDDLRRDPVAFARAIYRFIGVDENFVYHQAHEKVLGAARPRSERVARTVYRLSRMAHERGWIGLIGRVRNSPITRILYKPVSNTEVCLTIEEKRCLLAYFKDDIERLEHLLRRDLSAWRI